MKKVLIYTLLFVATISQTFAQKDAQARSILNAMSKKYHAYTSIKSDFTFTVQDQQNNVQQTQDGTLLIQARTNKYKLTLYNLGAKTVQEEITSDGKNQWTYITKDKEVQLNKAENSEEAFNPAKIFTIYEKGFKYIYTGDENLKGRLCQVIDLTPEADKEFFKVRLWIDKVKKQLYSATIFDKNGGRFTYTIKTFTPNVPVTENTFTYDSKAHPGIEVVDLR
ncbi:MAG: LolA family protein [Mucilaginibacter sp.]